ncbi:hypothetical protein [Bacillus safensis]|uniref:hypothetical protein n=2 Tax=Bacillus safensis TaxID=561879 RepID=UPI00146CABC5|nr:hypothetical protein [Bacillus safensis]NMW01966.1 hypothetical protein [Bacillus safensis]UXO88749.1 hypothetical protein N7921_03340 [Bacillus safensis]
MMWLYKYDENYVYIPGEEIELDEEADIPKGFTDVRPQDGFYKGKYDSKNKVWYESATQDYIDSLQSEIVPGAVELLKQQNSMLTKQIAQISMDAEKAKIREAQMAKQFAQLTIEIKSLKGGDS